MPSFCKDKCFSDYFYNIRTASIKPRATIATPAKRQSDGVSLGPIVVRFYMLTIRVVQVYYATHTMPLEVRKEARIRNRYNQVPHPSQDTKRESSKITINITNKSQEVIPIHAGDHKAAMNRRESMTNTRHK